VGIGPSRTENIYRNISKGRDDMIILGVVLLLIGLLTGVAILTSIGVIVAVVGLILWALGAAGHKIGGRPHYY
jgi:type IV secretory pathway TrbD component